MVLQRGPSKAAVYGFGHGPVTVRVAGTDEAGGAVSYSVAADPAAAAAGGGGGGGVVNNDNPFFSKISQKSSWEGGKVFQNQKFHFFSKIPIINLNN